MGQTPEAIAGEAPEASPGAALETYANNSSTLFPVEELERAADLRERAQNRRRERFRRRQVVWKVSTLERVRKCGRVSRGESELRIVQGSAGLTGLTHCASVWSCPTCSARILARRAQEIGSVLTAAHEHGHRLAFLTLTMRHRKGQRLADLWDAAGAAWTRCTSGRPWAAAKDRHGLVGTIRVWEVTQGGRNGWHVHVHVALVLAPDATADDLEQIGTGLFSRWSAGLVAAGLEAPMIVGQEWHMVEDDRAPTDVAEYMAKVGRSGASRERAPGELGLEMTHVNPGKSRADLRTLPVSDLLADLEETGDKAALTAWTEWEQASRGRRQVGWSKGLREMFTQMEEMTDAEIVAEEIGTEADAVLLLPKGSVAAIVSDPDRHADLLEAAERDGLPGAAVLLTRWGIPYRVP